MTFNLWENLVVQKRARAALEKLFLRNQYPPAIIFFGQKGVGKEAHALAFAQSINCEKNQFEPCGLCARCRSTFNFFPPDVQLIYALPTNQTEKQKVYKKVEIFIEKKKLIHTSR